jgi:hypothetical protein
MAASPSHTEVKVVAHRKDGTLVKGFTLDVPEFYRQSLGKPICVGPPDIMELHTAENGARVKVALNDLKALFFVKSFEGSTQYNEIKFFKAHPLQDGIWVRLQFVDNESTEGVIYNSVQFLVDRGFFLKPPDPHSNNEIVYIMKESLNDFRILGVRNSF